MRLIWTIFAKPASGLGSPSRSSTFAGGAMPAQFTTTRKGASSPARCTAARTCSGSVTSAGANTPPICSARSAPGEEGRSTMTTLAPPSARRWAVAQPSPLAPPVTSALDAAMSMCSPSNDCSTLPGRRLQATWQGSEETNAEPSSDSALIPPIGEPRLKQSERSLWPWGRIARRSRPPAAALRRQVQTGASPQRARSPAARA